MKISLPLWLLADILCFPRGCPHYFLCCYKTWLRHAILPRYKKRRRLARSLARSLVRSLVPSPLSSSSSSSSLVFFGGMAPFCHDSVRVGREWGLRSHRRGREGLKGGLALLYLCVAFASPPALSWPARHVRKVYASLASTYFCTPLLRMNVDLTLDWY